MFCEILTESRLPLPSDFALVLFLTFVLRLSFLVCGGATLLYYLFLFLRLGMPLVVTIGLV